MKILLASLGTTGDVHPFVAIGRHMKAAGHRVELLSNPVFAPLAAAAGIDFCGVGSEGDFKEAFAHHFAWHPINGLGVLWRYLAKRAMQASFQRIAEVHAEETCVVVYSPFFMPAARIAREALDVRIVCAYTAPSMIRSSQPPLRVAHWRLPRGTPGFVGTLGWALLDRMKMQPLVLADLQRLREPLGLAPIRQSVFGEWIHSPDCGVTLFPDWFCGAAPDWPRHIVQAGFPLYDGDQGRGLSAKTQAFLAAGDAPLVFTPGTAMRHASGFLEAAIQSSVALGKRAVLLTQAADQLPADMPASVTHTRYEPFGLLLPRACAVIHHGGIGTSAQALRAGLPQLVLPQAYDQFDNATRLETLGVARQLAAGDAGLKYMSQRLRELLHDSRTRNACVAAAARLAQDQPMQIIQRAIESQA